MARFLMVLELRQIVRYTCFDQKLPSGRNTLQDHIRQSSLRNKCAKIQRNKTIFNLFFFNEQVIGSHDPNSKLKTSRSTQCEHRVPFETRSMIHTSTNGQ